jgi:hypothetical protein
MRALIMVALITLSASACSRDRQTTTQAPAHVPPQPAPVPGAMIREVPVGLSGEAGGRRCQVNAVLPVYARPNDIVRWSFTVTTPECKGKKIKVQRHADEIDCAKRTFVQKVVLPVESCERDDQSTGELNSTIRLTCSIPPEFDGRRCYKYTIGGEVINGDPEIEIERPRASPSPTSTVPPPTAPPE